jgi:hypothetical protein
MKVGLNLTVMRIPTQLNRKLEAIENLNNQSTKRTNDLEK